MQCSHSFPPYILWLEWAASWWLIKFLNCLLVLWISSFMKDYLCIFPFFFIISLFYWFLNVLIFSRYKSSVGFTYIRYLLPLSVLPCHFHNVLFWLPLNLNSYGLSTFFLVVSRFCALNKTDFHVCKDIFLWYLLEPLFFCFTH